ncbi:unnamed protein product, partial [Acanthoscelides obtectus]
MEAFYLVNDCKDLPQTGWRRKLHTEFSKIHPELGLTEQNIVDRKRTIVKNGYLTQTETDELKREVGRAISQNAINDEVAPTRLSVLDQPHIEPECVTSQKQKELNDLFLSTLSFYRFSDPTKRPRLPKLLLNAKSNQIIHQMDEILLRHLEHCDDLEEVHLSIYAAAATVVNVNGQKLLPPNDAPLKKTLKRSEEPWKLRLMKDIDSCRAEADLISEYQGGNRSRKVIKKIADIKRKINVPASCDIDSSFLNLHRDKMRQEAKMKGARLQRYNETSKRKQQNALFERNQNQFYRSIISESSSEPKGIRDTQNFVKFWSDIWSEPKPSDLTAPWIKEVMKAAKIVPSINLPADLPNADDDQRPQYRKPTDHHLLLSWNSIGGAAAVLTLNKQKISTDTQVKNVPVTPAWQRRITNKIDSIRRDIGILTQNQSLNPSSSVTKKAKAILEREQSLENPTATEILDHLKQKLKAMAKKLRRYKESNTRRQHNSQFSRSERSFYKNLESEDHEIETLQENKVPTPEAMKTFWESTGGYRYIYNIIRITYGEDERSAVKFEYWKGLSEVVKNFGGRLLIIGDMNIRV